MADGETMAIEGLWPRVLEQVKARRRFTWLLLSQNAQVQSYGGGTLTLAWVNQGAMDNFTFSGSCGVLEEVLEEVVGGSVTVESVSGGSYSVPSFLTDKPPAAPAHVPAVDTPPPPPPDDSATAAVQRALGQTAFLMHEQGDDRAAALLADVGNVELRPAGPSGHWEAVLSTPRHLVARFTDDVLAAVQLVFEQVAGRHGLRISAVTAACALPEIGDDWRQALQAKLKPAAEAVSERLSGPRAGEAALPAPRREGAADRPSGCTRYAKTTGRRCRRDAAVWPAHDDLPTPVAACHAHLTAEEWEACQQARKQSSKEARIRADADADRVTHPDPAESATGPHSVPQPCTGECISKERAWGHDSDSASSACAKCDGWVCMACGQTQVDGLFEFCVDCTMEQSMQGPDPEWEQDFWAEAAFAPSPQSLLTTLVNDLVKKTNTTYPQVNARINRTIGVASRVGADEQVIRRAAGAARDWLERLDPPD